MSSCDLPDLVPIPSTSTKSLRIAWRPMLPSLREVRARLALARERAPLFDSAAFARDLEQLYLQIAQIQ